MLNITDKKFFGEIIADAIVTIHQTVADEKLRNRWVKAIAKGAATLEGDTTFIHWDSEAQALLFWSADSNQIYSANGVCQCTAFEKEQPCYHRAMSRLVKNYFEFQQKPNEIAKVDFADAVFFDAEMSAKEKIALLNLAVAEGRADIKPRVAALARHLN